MILPGQYRAVLVGTWWYWVSMGRAGWFLVILGQYGEVWLVHGWLVLVDV